MNIIKLGQGKMALYGIRYDDQLAVLFRETAEAQEIGPCEYPEGLDGPRDDETVLILGRPESVEALVHVLTRCLGVMRKEVPAS